MKKFNLFITIFFFLFMGAIGGYIYFLDGFNKTKTLQKEIESLQKIKQNIQTPVIVKPSSTKLLQKVQEYEEVVQKLEVDAAVMSDQNSITIDGSIQDTYDYMMVKRVLNIVKNDSVKLKKLCLGVGCNEYRYGFFINFSPYELTYQ